MNVVDSSGWLEYFAEGPNTRHFASVIGNTAELVVPAITVYEVFKVVLREANENAALQVAAALQKGNIVDITPVLAMTAARLSLQYALPMADAIILATARAHDAALWTQDEHFRDIPGVHCFPKRK